MTHRPRPRAAGTSGLKQGLGGGAERAAVALAAMLSLACSGCRGASPPKIAITFPVSATGVEAEVTRRQLERYMEAHPSVLIRSSAIPDSSDERHQLYVQWLNARARDPDVVQLDIVWTPEFAAAGWLLPLDSFEPDTEDFFPAAIEANRWQDRLYALPWFVDVGMLYWRTDLVDEPPATFADLAARASDAVHRGAVPYGFVWQGARYEGLVTVFVEVLGGYGGRILDGSGRVVVDSPPAVAALSFLRDAIHESGLSPPAVLTWQEEQTRFAFQNADAVFMRNWPYAYRLLQEPGDSKVAGRFSVAPMPSAPGGEPSATLGGWQLAINANSDHPEAAYSVIEYLLQPQQLAERLRVAGVYPARPSLYDPGAPTALPAIPPRLIERIIAGATARPRSPVYAELSEVLQVWLHRALSGQTAPAEALSGAAREMKALLGRAGLAAEDGDG